MSASPTSTGCSSTDEGEDLVWAIRIISGALRRAAADGVEDLPGGTRAYLVLTALASSGGEPPTQLALAASAGVHQTVITYLLDDLESHGLVARRQHPRDRRARQVVLTERGQERLADIRRRMAASEDQLLAVLGPDEAQVLRASLARVARGVQSDAEQARD